MRVSRYLLFLLAVNVVAFTGYYATKDWSATMPSQQSCNLNQGLTTSSNHRLLNSEPSTEEGGEVKPFSCDQCEHKKIPPSNPTFYVYIGIAICTR
jgi:hypothetical protein